MQPTCLVNANETRHHGIVSATEDAIERLYSQSKNISFYSVAKEAGVARSTLYRRDDLRKLVEEARTRNTSRSLEIPSKAQLLKGIAELESDLKCVRRELKKARCSSSLNLVRYAFVQFEEAA